MESFRILTEFENRKQEFYQLKERLTVTKPEDINLEEAEYDFQNIDENVPEAE